MATKNNIGNQLQLFEDRSFFEKIETIQTTSSDEHLLLSNCFENLFTIDNKIELNSETKLFLNKIIAERNVIEKRKIIEENTGLKTLISLLSDKNGNISVNNDRYFICSNKLNGFAIKPANLIYEKDNGSLIASSVLHIVNEETFVAIYDAACRQENIFDIFPRGFIDCIANQLLLNTKYCMLYYYCKNQYDGLREVKITATEKELTYIYKMIEKCLSYIYTSPFYSELTIIKNKNK